MKLAMKLAAPILAMFLLTPVAYAESTPEQLAQMVDQLKRNPSDNSLREQLIKAAQGLNPPPVVPDEAIEFEGRAQFAFKNAKAAADYLSAAKEYEKAVAVAPWVSGYYSDLCTIYEKAGKLEDAKRNCEFSLIGLTDTAQITDIKRRVAGLKYGIEQATKGPADGETFRDCADCPEMVAIPGKRYAVGKYEVTQAEWQAVMGDNPTPDYRGRGTNMPVEEVTWDRAQEYANRLSQKTGKKYRLPTSEEWEYSCYAGSKTMFCGSDNADAVAWYDDSLKCGWGSGRIHPVGQKSPNSFGLYDMSGNVSEWTGDLCQEKWCRDGVGANARICRGGSCLTCSGNAGPYQDQVRAASISASKPESGRGLRVWRSLQ